MSLKRIGEASSGQGVRESSGKQKKCATGRKRKKGGDVKERGEILRKQKEGRKMSSSGWGKRRAAGKSMLPENIFA